MQAKIPGTASIGKITYKIFIKFSPIEPSSFKDEVRHTWVSILRNGLIFVTQTSRF